MMGLKILGAIDIDSAVGFRRRSRPEEKERSSAQQNQSHGDRPPEADPKAPRRAPALGAVLLLNKVYRYPCLALGWSIGERCWTAGN